MRAKPTNWFSRYVTKEVALLETNRSAGLSGKQAEGSFTLTGTPLKASSGAEKVLLGDAFRKGHPPASENLENVLGQRFPN